MNSGYEYYYVEIDPVGKYWRKNLYNNTWERFIRPNLGRPNGWYKYEGFPPYVTNDMRITPEEMERGIMAELL